MPMTDHPDRFLDMENITIESMSGKIVDLHVLDSARYEGKDLFLVKLRGVDDRESAASFRGWLVTVSDDERVPLEDGEYWIDQLIGMRVLDEDGNIIGSLTDVIRTGSNDVYEIKTADGPNIAIPAIASVILEVDVSAKTMKVRIPEGLLDQ